MSCADTEAVSQDEEQHSAVSDAKLTDSIPAHSYASSELDNDGREDRTFPPVTELSISETERRYGSPLNLRDQYIVYLIEYCISTTSTPSPTTNTSTSNTTGCTWRRYSEFADLHERLGASQPHVVLPPLPGKRPPPPPATSPQTSGSAPSSGAGWSQQLAIDPFEPDFIERRRAALEVFLTRILRHETLSHDSLFLRFVQDNNEWRNIVSSTGYFQKLEHHLVSWNASMRVRDGDKRFDEILSYAKDMETNVAQLVRSGGRVLEALVQRHAQHSHYGRVLSEWAAREPVIGDCLQTAGHYMDALSVSIQPYAEQEQVYMERLREYQHYAVSVQRVCHNYTLRQYQLEKLQRSLETLSQRRQDALQGKQSVMWRWWGGSVDTEELREMRVADIDEQIATTQLSISKHMVMLNEFVEKALSDVESFQRRQTADLEHLMSAFVQLQITAAKKGVQLWNNIRQCIQVDQHKNQPS